MKTKMTLDHRQPTPEPAFRKGEIVVSQSETVIVVTDYQDLNADLFAGTVIHPGNSICAAGHTKENWDARAFTRLDGTVTLEQTP